MSPARRECLLPGKWCGIFWQAERADDILQCDGIYTEASVFNKWKDRGVESVNTDIKQKFCDLLGEERVLFQEPMNRHTTFRIGGAGGGFPCAGIC